MFKKDKSDPDANSLFNLNTLKAFIDALKSTVDIIEEPTVKELNLDHFTLVTTLLQLDSNEQTYMVGLWLKYLIKFTA